MTAYDKGFEDGLTAFAWWKDGQQHVGTSGVTLRDAKAGIKALWNYAPISDPLPDSIQEALNSGDGTYRP